MGKQGATLNTRADRLNLFMRIDKFLNKPLDMLTEKDFDILLVNLEAKKYSQGYISNYQKTYKKFCRLMLDTVPQWVTDMKIIRSDNVVQPQELLTQEEIHKMIDATNSVRNKALIAVLADSGMRVGAVGSLRIQNVRLEQKYGFLYISKTSKNQKTTGLKGIPITWSVGYLGQWLAIHPGREDINAPLWVSEIRKAESKKYEAVSYNRILTLVKGIAKDAKISKNIHPHIFRHKAITNWILEGLSEQEIKHRAGWSKGSSQMFKIYGNFTDDEMNKSILGRYGLGAQEKKILLEACPRCRVTLPPDAKFCPQCSLVLDQKALTDLKKYDDKMADLMERLLKSDEARKIIDKMNDAKI
jgi:integrase